MKKFKKAGLTVTRCIFCAYCLYASVLCFYSGAAFVSDLINSVPSASATLFCYGIQGFPTVHVILGLCGLASLIVLLTQTGKSKMMTALFAITEFIVCILSPGFGGTYGVTFRLGMLSRGHFEFAYVLFGVWFLFCAIYSCIYFYKNKSRNEAEKSA